jgi:hypothetical protein
MLRAALPLAALLRSLMLRAALPFPLLVFVVF